MKQSTTVYGMYGKWGYRVCTSDGDELYVGGNCPGDSIQIVDDGLSLRTLRSYCIQTAKEIANEKGLLYVGVQREEDND